MLRATIDTNGSQSVQESVVVPNIMVVHGEGLDDADFEALVIKTRQELAYKKYDSTKWPLYEIRLSQNDDKTIFHYSTDLLIADFASIQILLAELGEFYNHSEYNPDALSLTFRDIIVNQKKQKKEQNEKCQEDKKYWTDRLSTMPDAPELPMFNPVDIQKNLSQIEESFYRLSFKFPEDAWQKFCQSCYKYYPTLNTFSY